MLELIDFVRDIIVCPMLLTTFLSFILGVAFFIIGGVSSIIGFRKKSALLKKVERTSLTTGRALFFVGSVSGIIVLISVFLLVIIAAPGILEELEKLCTTCS